MRFVPPPKLGVGFTYQRGLPQAIRRLVDFYEVSPDVLCRERVTGGERVLSYHEDLLDEALEAIADRPVIVHGLGLSIALSKINTEGTKVADVVYVNELDGSKVAPGPRFKAIRDGLLAAASLEKQPLNGGVG